MRHCDHNSLNRVIVPGDFQPDGRRYPRCADCHHRVCADLGPLGESSDCPTSTRRIAMSHPSYVYTEIRGRILSRFIVWLGQALKNDYKDERNLYRRANGKAL